MSFFYCNLAAYFSRTAWLIDLLGPRRGSVLFMCGGVQDILKIASYALCFDSSESGKFEYPKHCDTKMPMVCIYARTRICVYLY